MSLILLYFNGFYDLSGLLGNTALVAAAIIQITFAKKICIELLNYFK